MGGQHAWLTVVNRLSLRPRHGLLAVFKKDDYTGLISRPSVLCGSTARFAAERYAKEASWLLSCLLDLVNRLLESIGSRRPQGADPAGPAVADAHVNLTHPAVPVVPAAARRPRLAPQAVHLIVRPAALASRSAEQATERARRICALQRRIMCETSVGR